MVPKGHQVLPGPRVPLAFPASQGFLAQPSWDRLAPLAHRALRDHLDCKALQVTGLSPSLLRALAQQGGRRRFHSSSTVMQVNK